MNDDASWKMIYLARRNPRLAAEEFPQAWREHSALGRNCRNVQQRVQGVTQCVRLLTGLPPDASTAYDGVNLLRLRDRESADAIWSDPETLATMRPDEPRVFDRYVRECALVAREQVLQQGPTGDAVLLACLKRRAAVAPADFERALALPGRPWDGVQKTVLNLVQPERPAGYDWDAIVECWFPDAARMSRSIAGRRLTDALPVLYRTVCDFSASVFLPTRVSHRRP
ncbi:MAG: EthD domain-containing protein [Proteobacteria bacterium]|nr:EthD domain-containing protein [Pseudomonadota bacterium]